MPVDDRLRIALAANAEVMTPGVERHLEEVRRRRRRELRLRWTAAGGAVAAATVAVLLTVIPGRAPETADPVDTPPSPTPTDASYDGPRVPDGSYGKVATLREARERALDLDVVGPHLGEDGRLPIVIRFVGDRFTVYVTEDDGVRVVGDFGTLSYDAAGRLVMVSESPGCPACRSVHEWSVGGGRLRLSFAPGQVGVADDARLVVEGTFGRSGG